MKKTIITTLCAVLGWMLSAAEPAAVDRQKSELTPEQQKEQKALIEKYDANKNGRLDKEEIEKMTPEDRAKWDSLNPGKEGEGKSEKDADKK